MAENKDGELQLKITLDDGSIVQGFLNINKKAKETGAVVESEFGQALNGLKDGLAEIAPAATSVGSKILTALSSPLGLVSAAVVLVGETVKGAFELTVEGEKLNKIEKQFDALSESAGIAGERLKKDFLGSLGGVIDDSEAIQSLNKALVSLGSRAQDLPKIMEIARKATNAFGGDVTDRFEAINQAISSGATRQLKAIGININAEQAYKTYAKSIGSTASVLSEAGKQQAILNQVLEIGGRKFASVGTDIGGTTTSFQRLSVSIKNIIESIEQFVANNYGEAFAAFFNAIDVGLKKLTGNFKVADKFKELNAEIEQTQIRVNQLTFAKFEREGQSGIAAFLQPFKDGEGILANVNVRLLEQKARLKELNEQLLKAKEANSTDPAPAGVTSKKDATELIKDLERRKAIELEFSQFQFGQQQARAASEASQNAILLNLNLDAKTKQGLVDENFAAQSKLSEEQLSKDILGIREKLKNDTSPESLATQNAEILSVRETFNQQRLLQEQQYREQSKSYTDQIVFDQLDAYDKIAFGFSRFGKGFSDAAAEFKNTAVKSFQEVGKQAFSSLTKGVGGAFAAFGAALAKGEDASKAFLQSTLKFFGELAVNIGTYFIALGAAKLFGLPQDKADALPLIAAGAALATLGGVLGSFGGGSSSSASSSGGGISSSPSTSTDLTPSNQLQRKAPDTNVQVVVNGNIFDSDESGSRIVDLINSAFDKKGVVISSGAVA